MTDEEKKAIEDLKEVVELYNDKCLITTEDDFKSIEILLNLIEKQSKEIEKKNKRYEKIIEHKDNKCEELLEFVETEKETDYVSKDKIKAKIEEIDKILNEDIYSIEGHYDDRYYRYLQDRHVLQSLLKE